MQKIVVTFGSSQKKDLEKKIDEIIIDITDPAWGKILNDYDLIEFYCTNEAYILARKLLPGYEIKSIDLLFTSQENKSSSINAVRLGDTNSIVVTNKFNPAVKKSNIWINTHHLELMKELFSAGYVIELLDENGKLIDTVERKNTKT